MNNTPCPRDESVLAAAQSENWTDELRTHLTHCASCQQVVQIAGWMQSLAVVEHDLPDLPDAKLIWLKAQLAQRRASATEALKPVDIFQKVAWGVSTLMALLGVLAKWTLMEQAIVWLNAGWGSLVSQAGWAGWLLVVSILTLGLVGAASLFSLDREGPDRTGGHMKKRTRFRNLPILLALLLSVGCSRFDNELVGEFQHRSSDGFRRLQVASTGQIEFTEDERDIQHISPGGHFVVQEKKGLTTRRLEVEPGPDGKLSRSYTYRGEPNFQRYVDTAKPDRVTIEHLARPGPNEADNPHHFVVFEVDGDRLWIRVVSSGTGRFEPHGVPKLELVDRVDATSSAAGRSPAAR